MTGEAEHQPIRPLNSEQCIAFWKEKNKPCPIQDHFTNEEVHSIEPTSEDNDIKKWELLQGLANIK